LGRQSKVALLQSKRLHPEGGPVREETRVDASTTTARMVRSRRTPTRSQQ
jgi:hypothetical protein